MTPQAQQKLVRALNADEQIFDLDQFKGYMAAITLAPVAIPNKEWAPVLLDSVESEHLASVANDLHQYFEHLKLQLEDGRFRLPTLANADSNLSIFDGQPHKLRQWSAGFQAGVTDFVGYWQVEGPDATKVQECVMELSCLAFEESARYFAEELQLDLNSFVFQNRERMLRSIKFLRTRAPSKIVEPAPAMVKDGRVEVLLTTSDLEQQVGIAEAILQDNSHCAEAWDVLARYKSENVEQVQQCLEHAVAAAETQLGASFLTYFQGRLWYQQDAKILLQVLVGLGACYKKQKRYERSAACYEKALLLDSDDNVGAQAALLTIYFLLGRYDAVGNILAYYDTQNAWSIFSKALLSYVKEGDSSNSKHLRALAKAQNKHVPKYLAGRAKLPERVGVDYVAGSKDEAAIYAEDARGAWRKVLGSIAWLLN